ncbi:hypothetical protein SASPL_156431 [Salvia splendens]|uniref:Protein kinase domain-containing protein n=1 Tax=Salvia splendens TaxID=180675 RepID=A0A8X8VWP7_SALSN|nr:hypothetical protein SASPL_156431 [Salvia splendens]
MPSGIIIFNIWTKFQLSLSLSFAGYYSVRPSSQLCVWFGQRSPTLQMKKTQSPLIIRPGHIRRLNTNSGDRSTQEEDRHKSNNPALSYITSAAKKVGGVFSVIFFGRKKADPASSRDQVQPDAWHYRAGQSPNFAGNSGARDSRRSSRSRRSSYDAYPEVDPAKLRDSLAFKEIYNATGNFSLDNKIGEGGFGTVYKGRLKDGRVVAVKRAKSVRCAIKLGVEVFLLLPLFLNRLPCKQETYDQRLSAEFKNEILALSKIEHLSLVRFYGCLEHGDERLIIVEYVSNGTLREHLDGRSSNSFIRQLNDVTVYIIYLVSF